MTPTATEHRTGPQEGRRPSARALTLADGDPGPQEE